MSGLRNKKTDSVVLSESPKLDCDVIMFRFHVISMGLFNFFYFESKNFSFSASLSKGSDNERRVSRRADSSEEGSRQRRRRLSLKRRRASEDDDDDSDESEEEERPVRKRVNRIDSDDDSDEDKKQAPEQEEEEEEGGLGKGATPLEYNLVELPPTNGQSPVKGLEGLMNRPGAGTAMGAPDLLAHLGPKNLNVATPVVAIAPNGLVSQEMASQEDDEDDLLGVTDLVDYVCNSEQL